jgi:hypothetical protein
METSFRVAEKLGITQCALAVFRDSLGWPADRQPPRFFVGDFSQALIGTSIFQVAELIASPNQLHFNRKSRSVL